MRKVQIQIARSRSAVKEGAEELVKSGRFRENDVFPFVR